MTDEELTRVARAAREGYVSAHGMTPTPFELLPDSMRAAWCRAASAAVAEAARIRMRETSRPMARYFVGGEG